MMFWSNSRTAASVDELGPLDDCHKPCPRAHSRDPDAIALLRCWFAP